MKDKTFNHLFSVDTPNVKQFEKNHPSHPGRKSGVPNCGGYSITNNSTGEVVDVPILAHAVRILFEKTNFFSAYNNIQVKLSQSKKKTGMSVAIYRNYTFKRLSPSAGVASLARISEEAVNW